MNRVMNGFMQPSEKEIAELEAARQQEHEDAEIFNAELAGSKGEAYPDDPMVGTDAADAKARRQARGWVAREDFETTPQDPVDTYTGPRSADEVGTSEELRDYVEYKENLARENYPDYDAIIDRYVMPNLKGVDPQELQQWLLRGDFAEKAYEYGLKEKKRLRNQLPSAEEIDNMSAEQFTEALDALRTGGAEDEKESDGFISRREMKRMNRMANPVDFGKALDSMKWRGR